MLKATLTLSLLAVATVAKADTVVVQSGQMFLTSEAEPQAEKIKSDPAAGKSFMVKQLKLKKGDKITFKNDDKVTHNVYGDDFDLKAQPVGDTRSETFSKPGHYTVKCAIHPKMKFDVVVEE